MSRTMKQCQVVATEARIKDIGNKAMSAIKGAVNRGSVFSGFTKRYTPKKENDTKYPDERRKVQLTVKEAVDEMKKQWCPIIKASATKDFGNTVVKADLVVDGKTIIKDVPATFLLHLEKELNSLKTFFTNLPILDSDEDWILDENAGFYKTTPVVTWKTRKEQEAIVLYDATEHHPAQTQLISKDIDVGTWETIKHSGAIPAEQKNKYVENLSKLILAVVSAREKANATAVEVVEDVGETLYDFITG